MNFGNFGIGEMTLVFMVILLPLLAIWPTWRIVAKTGHPGVLSLALMIPLVNIILWLYFAFSEWPIETELNARRAADGVR